MRLQPSRHRRALCGTLLAFVIAPLASAQSNYATPYYFTTLAGAAGERGSADGNITDARFNYPYGLALDRDGSLLIADSSSGTIRTMTRQGQVTTLIATDHAGDTVRFGNLCAIAADTAGNLFAADSWTNAIYKITPSGAATLLAKFDQSENTGPTAGAFLFGPGGVAVDRHGNVFATDTNRAVIRKIAPNGEVTIAGHAAQLALPWALALDREDNLYVTDVWLNTIQKIALDGTVTLIAGKAETYGFVNGTGNLARFSFPGGLAVDGVGNLIVADIGTIRKITADGVVTTLAGNSRANGVADGWGRDALFGGIWGVAVDRDGTIFVADTEHHTIRVSVSAPRITTHPITHTVAPGATATLAVTTESRTSVSYQWRKNGLAISGATAATLALRGVQSSDLGNYSVSVTNVVGSALSNLAAVTFPAAQPSSIANVSIRGRVDRDRQDLMVGFVIGGDPTNGGKPLLIRAAGPSLEALGISGVLADPHISLLSGNTIIASNDNWNGNPDLAAIGAQVGAFPFPFATSRDAALYLPGLGAGAYTARLFSAGDTSGLALAEIYDASPLPVVGSANPRLINVSARAHVGAGADIVIAGFTLAGSAAKSLLIRVAGPSLQQFGVKDVMSQPKLELFQGSAILQSNEQWNGNALVTSAEAKVGAFAFDEASRDAALLVTLHPGTYTLQVSGVADSTGIALLEIYEVP